MRLAKDDTFISYWAVPEKLLAGFYPGAKEVAGTRKKLSFLLDKGVRSFIDLTERGEVTQFGPLVPYDEVLRDLAKERRIDVFYIRLAIRDVSVPSKDLMERILYAIDDSLANGKPVYVHCLGGKGRTGTVVGCYYLKHSRTILGTSDRANAPRLALERIVRLRKEQGVPLPAKSPETAEQKNFVRGWETQRPSREEIKSKCRGCLLGGAVGDALGAPVEFMKEREIFSTFGEGGIRDYVPAYGRIGAITDDTQMTLFTAEGLLRAHVRHMVRGIGASHFGVVANAYLRWLTTQGEDSPARIREWDDQRPGWLISHKELFSRRAPGVTCIKALKAKKHFMDFAKNDSKGCGGVMRAAPVGMFTAHWTKDGRESIERTHVLGGEIAALTHGHPTGIHSSGALAVIIAKIMEGSTLPEAIDVAKDVLKKMKSYEETLAAIEAAEKAALRSPGNLDTLKTLGEGWIAEEALSMSLYCALSAEDFESGVVLAVNHSGDSDSTGSITGNILGAVLGVEAIPERWLTALELRGVVDEMAVDLAEVIDWDIDEYALEGTESYLLQRKYPGH